MKKLFYVIMFAAIATSFESCIAIQSTTISDIKPSGGTEVSATTSGCGVLHLSVPKGIAERAASELKSKGVTGNVTTVLTMREWGIIQYYKVSAKGTTE
jgi:hypothetical protein